MRNYGDPPEKFDLHVPSFKVTRGHWNRHVRLQQILISIAYEKLNKGQKLMLIIIITHEDFRMYCNKYLTCI